MYWKYFKNGEDEKIKFHLDCFNQTNAFESAWCSNYTSSYAIYFNYSFNRKNHAFDPNGKLEKRASCDQLIVVSRSAKCWRGQFLYRSEFWPISHNNKSATVKPIVLTPMSDVFACAPPVGEHQLSILIKLQSRSLYAHPMMWHKQSLVSTMGVTVALFDCLVSLLCIKLAGNHCAAKIGRVTFFHFCKRWRVHRRGTLQLFHRDQSI